MTIMKTSLPRLFVCLFFLVNHVAYASTVYVNDDASGSNDGTSWADAYLDLQSALTSATSGDEIWVAAGTYVPTTDTDRTATFQLKSGVAIYAGFAGTESTVSERLWETNTAILSGDIGAQGDDTDNSYHILTGSATDSSAIVDGFTLSKGRADGDSAAMQHQGGAMYNDAGTPTLKNLIFTDNFSQGNGAAMANWNGSDLTLSNATFSNNQAKGYAGAVFNKKSSPTLTDVTFESNRASVSGGGMYNQSQSSPTLTNVVFRGNRAYWAGAMINEYSSHAILNNVLFSGNKASKSGGAITNKGNSHPTLTNVTIVGNLAGNEAGAIGIRTGTSMTLNNCIIWNNSPTETQVLDEDGTSTINHSIIQGGWTGTANLDADPKFVTSIDPASAPTTSGDFHLNTGSPAIAAGDNSLIASGVSTDLDGNPRISHGTVNMGAYEGDLVPATNKVPTIAGSPETSVTANTAYSFIPTANDDEGETLTFSITGKPDWADFDTSTGKLSGTPNSAGTHSGITITVSDDQDSASLAAFTVTVNAPTPSNHAPTISGTPATSVTVGNAYTFTPTASDSDGDSLTFSISSKPAWANFDTSTGKLTGTPNSASEHSGITITVSDGKASANLAAFSLTVMAMPNNAPSISGTPTTTLTAASAYTFTPSASDSDGDSLTFSITAKPDWADFDTSTGKLSGTPNSASEHSGITISVSDGTDTVSLEAFTVTVTISTQEQTEFSGVIAAHNEWRQQVGVDGLTWHSELANAAQTWANTLQDQACKLEHNPNTPYGENIYWASGTSPTPKSVVDSWGSEKADYDYDTNICQPDKVCGHYTQIVWEKTTEVGCGKAACANEHVWVCNYNPPGNSAGQKPYTQVVQNTKPTLSGTPLTLVDVNTPYQFTPTANDSDSGDSLSFSITGKPAWANLNATTGELSGTPTEAGTFTNIIISVSDGTDTVSLPAFEITVNTVSTPTPTLPPNIAGLIVTTTEDSGAGSLRQILADASDGETIGFDASLAGQTIAFATTLEIDKSVTLDGNGRNLTLSGDSDNDGVGNILVMQVQKGKTVTLNNLTITKGNNQSGGGLHNAGTLTINNCTFVENTDTYWGGGAIRNDGTLTINNSTFANNQANRHSAAIYNRSGVLTINHSTFSGNHAKKATETGTIGNHSTATLHLKNSIIANSTGTYCSGVLASNLNNLIADGSCSASFSGEAMLGELQDNGGDTLTFPLLAGSSAINTGDNTVCAAIHHSDQRDYVREDGLCDLGAIEVGAQVNQAPILAGTPTTSLNVGNAYTFTPTASDPDGHALTFTIENQPAWANFNPQTGELSGNPSNGSLGTTHNIVISVADFGGATVALSPFNLTVKTDVPNLPGSLVTNTLDDGVGSLRQVIANANAGDTLVFDISIAGQTIHLASPLFINKNITIEGSGRNLTLSGDSNHDGIGDVRVIEIQSGGTVTLNNLTITKGSNNAGGGLHNNGTLTINNCTFVENTDTYWGGGAIRNEGTLTINNSTFANNQANRHSAAIYNRSGVLTINHSTFSGNRAKNAAETGSLGNHSTATLHLKNSIIANSTGSYCSGVLASNLNNLIADGSCSPSFLGDPILGELQDNGGETLTFALNAGSPAINAADCTAIDGTVITIDQRKSLRNDGQCDLGAYEFGMAANQVPVIAGTPPLSIDEGNLYEFIPTVTDTDGQTLTFRIENQPLWAEFNTSTGFVSGTPLNEQVGTTAPILISVTDGIDTSSLPAFQIEVMDVNAAPRITGTVTTTAYVGIPYTAVSPFTEIDGGDSITGYRIENQPLWLTFNTQTGELGGTPTVADLAISQAIQIIATDTRNASTTFSFDLEVIHKAALALNPTTPLQLAGTVGEAAPSQTFTVSNAAQGTLNWTIETTVETHNNAGLPAGYNWLQVSQASGSDLATLTVSADLSGLVSGIYIGHITVAAEHADNSPQTLDVQLTVTEPQSLPLDVQPSSLTFSALLGGVNPAPQTLTLSNYVGTPHLTRVDNKQQWITWANQTKTASYKSYNVWPKIAELAVGIHQTNIKVYDDRIPARHFIVPVTMHITDNPEIIPNRTQLQYGMLLGAEAPAAQYFTLRSSGASELPWTATSDQNWLLLSATSGQTPATVDVIIADSQLTQVGTHTATINITGGTTSQSIQVSFTIFDDSKIALYGLEITQGVQDLLNSVPLFLKRKTFVRAHVRSRTDEIIENMTATLKVKQGNSLIGELNPVNNGGSIDVIPNPNRAHLNDSFLFEVPIAWLKPNITFKFKGKNQPVACQENASEPHDCQATLSFDENFILPLTFVDVVRINSETGEVRAPSQANRDFAQRNIVATYPLSELDFYYHPTPIVAEMTEKHITKGLNGLSSKQAEIGRPGYYHALTLGSQGNIAGLATVGGNRACSIVAGYVIPHEMGHNMGFANSRNKPIDFPFSADYPLEMTGDRAVYRLDIHDKRLFMPADKSVMQGWIASPYHYRYIHSVISRYIDWQPTNTKRGNRAKTRSGKTPITQALLITGQLLPTANQGQIDRIIDTETRTATPEPGDYTVRIEDSQGNELAAYPFGPTLIPNDADDMTSGENSYRFELLLPREAAMNRIAIMQQGQAIATRNASANRPNVTVLSPNGGEKYETGIIPMTWQAHDADGDALNYTIEYSVDAGQSWQLLAAQWQGTSLNLDTSLLPGAREAQIRVWANDGFHTKLDSSDSSFTVVGKPPTASLFTEDGGLYITGQTLILEGHAFDKEDGQLASSALTWHSSRNGELGTGNHRLLADNLAIGEHRLTLTATDSDGLTDTASITVQIFRDRPAVLPARLAVSSRNVYLLSNGEALSDTIEINNLGEASLNWTAISDVNGLQLLAISDAAPSQLKITAKPTGLEIGEYTGTVTITGSNGDIQTVEVMLTLNQTPHTPVVTASPYVSLPRLCSINQGTIDQVCHAGDRILSGNVVVGENASMSHAIFEGEIDNEGLISNSLITPTALLTGGILSGYIENEGTLKDFEFRGMSIIGGTLAGNIRNSSQVGGYFQDVQLAPNTEITGGQLSGSIIGDAQAPAWLENLSIKSGSHLDNVIIAHNVTLGESVTLGEGVRWQMRFTSQATGIDNLGNPVDNLQTAFDCLTHPVKQIDTQPVRMVTGETLSFSIHISLDQAHVQQAGELLIIQQNAQGFEMLVGEQWLTWDGSISHLEAVESYDALPETLEHVLQLTPPEGEYTLYIGYRLSEEGTLIYNGEQPIQYIVD